MTSQWLLVTDTNIWIDLENGGILRDVFKLPYRFLISDFAVPELIHPEWQTLQALGLIAHELTADGVAELSRLRPAHMSLSITDLTAFIITKMLDVILLTGDWRLSELATANGVSVHGVLWLLDEMVQFQVLTTMQAADALSRMLDKSARLPPNECRKRLAIWLL